VNALFNERVGEVCTLQSSNELTVTIVQRKLTTDAGAFTLVVIEAPSPLEGDVASVPRMTLIQEALTGRSVDAAVYIDRLDVYRVESADKLVRPGSIP
jgi:hypothetical protein